MASNRSKHGPETSKQSKLYQTSQQIFKDDKKIKNKNKIAKTEDQMQNT